MAGVNLCRAAVLQQLPTRTDYIRILGANHHRVREIALLSAFFSVVALVLVIVGLYGVLSYSVVQRTREIGIRLALGAQPLRVVGLVLSETGALTIAWLVLGAAGAAFAARFITVLLFEVKPSDLWIIAVPLTCLLVACTLSGLVPGCVRSVSIRRRRCVMNNRAVSSRPA